MFFVRGNTSDATDLLRPASTVCSTVIVLADNTNTSNEPDDLDVLLAAHHPRRRVDQPQRLLVRGSGEVGEPPALQRTRADELVVSAEVTGALPAASARTHGLTGVHLRPPHPPRGPGALPGAGAARARRPERAARLEVLKDVHDSLLVGVFVDGGCLINPPSDTLLPADAELLVVRDRPITHA